MAKLTLFGKIVIGVALFLIAYYVLIPWITNPRPSQNIASLIAPAPTSLPTNPASETPLSAPAILEVVVVVSPFEPSSLQLLNDFKDLSQDPLLMGKFSYRAIDFADAPSIAGQFPESSPPFFVLDGKAFNETDSSAIQEIVSKAIQ